MRTWLSNVNPRFQQNPTRYWIFNMQGIEDGGPLFMVDSVTKRYTRLFIIEGVGVVGGVGRVVAG